LTTCTSPSRPLLAALPTRVIPLRLLTGLLLLQTGIDTTAFGRRFEDHESYQLFLAQARTWPSSLGGGGEGASGPVGRGLPGRYSGRVQVLRKRSSSVASSRSKRMSSALLNSSFLLYGTLTRS
jgi:hypothetical protein